MPRSAIYQSLLEQAARAGTTMLSQVLATTRQSIREDAQRMRSLLERDQLELSVKLLDSHAMRMCERLPVILTGIFRRTVGTESKLGLLSGQALRLDQLELMDEDQVQERVEMARVLQHVLLKSEAALTELNTYVCALMGFDHVVPERNPLRPESYVAALQQLMTELTVPALVRKVWLHHMAAALGEALSAAYLEWSGQLQMRRVQGVGFSVVRMPLAASGSGKGVQVRSERAIWTPQYRQTVLTLDRLRRLMAGNLDASPDTPLEAFARQFARDFESGADDGATSTACPPETGFEATLPAALDALQEMQQVDVVVQRMQQRPVPPVGRADAGMSAALVREELTQSATAMSQVLSLEVVSLMVDNLVQDARLLAPVRKIIERLEPALLRLVIIDPRFFLDRQHPARRLLQEISARGLAFGTTEDPDFNAFLLSLQRHVSPLAVMQIDGVQPFVGALQHLLQEWDDPGARATITSQIDSAVAVLGYAEQRNLLAEQMTIKLRAIPAIRQVPLAMVDFLCGPWSQVMAEAQLKDTSKSDDPGQYKELVNELLWSAQPDLTRKDVARLTRLVSRLLAKLREGLGLIDYPSIKTSAFFDVLMKLHQQAFRPATKEVPPKAGLAESLLTGEDPWLAPAEAKASGFMAFPDEVRPHAAAPQPNQVDLLEPDLVAKSLKAGAWVELEGKTGWQRLQLSWISPHNTMYLFTSARGKTQSMTQRLLERLLSQGKLRVVSDQASMLDGALDAVVHTATLNSIDVKA
ncbi:MAG TPA: DUF1631 family protein [Rhodoferax sp.]|nr:DUF1631 family protein [Rhodoferax sp.]